MDATDPAEPVATTSTRPGRVARLRSLLGQMRAWLTTAPPPPLEASSPVTPVRRGPPPLPPALAQRVEAIETAALAVYARHNLPIQPGDYRKGPKAKRWVFVGDARRHEDRWADAMAYPSEKGWRHARLEDLGGLERAPHLIEASQLLIRCRWLRGRVSGALPGDPVQDLAAAIDLGAAWRALDPPTKPRAPAAVKPPAPSRLKFQPAAPATGRAPRVPRSGS